MAPRAWYFSTSGHERIATFGDGTLWCEQPERGEKLGVPMGPLGHASSVGSSSFFGMSVVIMRATVAKNPITNAVTWNAPVRAEL